MGGRMQFAPTNVILRCSNTTVILEILKILIRKLFTGNITQKYPSPLPNHMLVWMHKTLSL